jgi:hypothetical protein
MKVFKNSSPPLYKGRLGGVMNNVHEKPPQPLPGKEGNNCSSYASNKK